MTNSCSDICEVVTDLFCRYCSKAKTCLLNEEVSEVEFHDVLIECMVNVFPVALTLYTEKEGGY